MDQERGGLPRPVDWLKISARWSFYRGNAARPLDRHATRFVARVSVNDGLAFFHVEWNRE